MAQPVLLVEVEMAPALARLIGDLSRRFRADYRVRGAGGVPGALTTLAGLADRCVDVAVVIADQRCRVWTVRPRATGSGTAIDGAVGVSRPRANRSVGCLAVSQGVVRIGRSPGGFRVLPVYAGLRPVVCDVAPAQVGQPVVQLRGAVVSGGVPVPFLGGAAPVPLHLPVRPLFEPLHALPAFGVGVHAYRSFA